MNTNEPRETSPQPGDERVRRIVPRILRRIARLATSTWYISEDEAYTDTREYAPTPRAFSESIASERHPERNEDSCFTIDEGGQMLAGGVFDGVGGNPGSERASYNAANFIFNQFNQLPHDVLTPDNAARFTRRAFLLANKTISKDSCHIATTAAVASLHTNPNNQERFVNIAWAGDSRVTIIRGGYIHYRTLDDGMTRNRPALDELFPNEAPEYRQQAFLESAEGDIDPRLASLFRSRNMIKNCLDGVGGVDIHTIAIYTEPGDTILITSDGIHDNLTNAEILEIINTGGTVTQLVDAALERSRDFDHIRGKSDDITGVILVA